MVYIEYLEYYFMAYDNIKVFVSSAIKKIIFSWTLFFIFNIAFMVVYNTHNNKIKTIDKQILNFSEIGAEATTVLYYNSQKNVASEINYEKLLLNQWLVNDQEIFTTIIPSSLPEVTLLQEFGDIFYSEENLNVNNESVENFQNLSDQLNLLSRLSVNYIDNSILKMLTIIFIPLSSGLLLLLIIMTLLISKTLQRKLLSKNEFILEDMWTELQDIEFNTQPPHLLQALHDVDIPNAYSSKIGVLIEETKNINIKTNTIKEALRIYQLQLQEFTIPTENYKPDPQTQEKILIIQKLLSRLFTRAERASSLAKASAENGFQAGILALNVSIEAARVGNAGKNFIPISDRVKDFAEKSSQIGNAILEELKDANLSIRKAYAVGKGMIEILPETPNEPSNNNNKHLLPDISELHNIMEACDNVVLLTKRIQNISLELENTLEMPQMVPQQPSSNKDNSFLKAILVRSFERLYRLSYGIDPPPYERNDFSNEI